MRCGGGVMGDLTDALLAQRLQLHRAVQPCQFIDSEDANSNIDRDFPDTYYRYLPPSRFTFLHFTPLNYVRHHTFQTGLFRGCLDCQCDSNACHNNVVHQVSLTSFVPYQQCKVITSSVMDKLPPTSYM